MTHIQNLGCFCLLIFFCSVLEFYKRLLHFLLGFIMMDCASFFNMLNQNSGFRFGFFVFGCFSRFFNWLGLFFLLAFGLKVLQYGCQDKDLIRILCEFGRKSRNLIDGFCSKFDLGEVCVSKILSSKCGLSELIQNLNQQSICNSAVKPKVNLEDEEDSDNGEEEEEQCDEDEVVDVMSLRKMIKAERGRANGVCMELEKERMAAASAAEEAMAMILRLQNEKSSMEIEGRQYRRMAEQKQQYDQEVIEALRWMVMKHESERSLLEDQLRLCNQKLKQFMKNDEYEGIDSTLSFSHSIMEDGLNDVLIGSLGMEL